MSIRLQDHVAEIPDFPKPGILFYDISPLLAHSGAWAEAVEELERDDVVQAALGPIADEFIALKTQEWDEYGSQVSSWEIDKYLTFF